MEVNKTYIEMHAHGDRYAGPKYAGLSVIDRWAASEGEVG